VVERSRVAEGDLSTSSYLAGFPPSDLALVRPFSDRACLDAGLPPSRGGRDMAEIVAQGSELAVEMFTTDRSGRRAGDRALTRCGRGRGSSRYTKDNPGCGGTADATGLLKGAESPRTPKARCWGFCATSRPRARRTPRARARK
jgi:hypothetical protein